MSVNITDEYCLDVDPHPVAMVISEQYDVDYETIVNGMEHRLMKFLSLNLRHDTDRWLERRPLILDELRRERPDVIAFQEVSMRTPVQQARDIAEALDESYQVIFEPKWKADAWEGIALLSRLPVISRERLKLPGEGGRVAQAIRVETDGQMVDIANTHLHHQPIDDESIRLPQARALLEWMNRPTESPSRWLLAGDFNARPASETVRLLKDRFDSVYRAYHGTEPPRTFPTPLVEKWEDYPTDITIDFIFFDPDCFSIQNAYIIGAQSHPDDATLYPSDHYGLATEISLKTEKPPEGIEPST